ncbi:glycosyltransferase family 2 protein, partial [Candidatus Parvarchaeota archaeon]|nr:glycosyltransferase family 2 protein [Candidatus Parvarchaeota archaeon]
MAKLLSICITSFNRKDAIERLLAQLELVATPHLRDVEVCITDNCSTDGSWELFTQLKQKTRLDLHLSRNNTNIGFDANYLKSIQMGTGQWVWTCGDDDYPAHAGFEALLAALKSGNYTDAP